MGSSISFTRKNYFSSLPFHFTPTQLVNFGLLSSRGVDVNKRTVTSHFCSLPQGTRFGYCTISYVYFLCCWPHLSKISNSHIVCLKLSRYISLVKQLIQSSTIKQEVKEARPFQVRQIWSSFLFKLGRQKTKTTPWLLNHFSSWKMFPNLTHCKTQGHKTSYMLEITFNIRQEVFSILFSFFYQLRV